MTFAMFLSADSRAALVAYLARHLAAPVTLTAVSPLPKSSRDAPWRIDLTVDGAARSVVLRLGDPDELATEFAVLDKLALLPPPTPAVYGLDTAGDALGVPSFFSDYVPGESLLEPMLTGEAWAEELYIDTAIALQQITAADLGSLAHTLDRESPADILEGAYRELEEGDDGLAEDVYKTLLSTMPSLPKLRFSNGDLWLDNILVRDEQLSGVIDFAQAGFSDPVYEFLLPFFVRPELRGRGLEQRYCRRIGVDPATLIWYRGLELFDTWRWVVRTGRPFLHYTEKVLEERLGRWLDDADEDG